MMSESSVHPFDRSAEPAHPAPPPNREDLRDRAAAEAMLAATGPETSATAFASRVEQWLAQWLSAALTALGVARRDALDRIRDAGTALTRSTARLNLVLDRLATARAERDRLGDITDGRAPGDDGGRWPARARTGPRSRGALAVDVLIYGGAAVAEIGLNYLAFQLMGSSPWETAVLAAAIVLVNVLLPKQIGELLTRHRRAVLGRGRLLAGIVLGSLLWLAVSVFVALVRTAFLLLPAGAALDPGASALIVEAGLDAGVLTWGWLAVVLAVGLVVLFRAAARYNPYVTALRGATARVERLQEEKLDATAAAQDAQLQVQRAWEAHQSLQAAFDTEQARLTALAADTVAHHRAELDRLRSSAAVVALRRSIEGGP
jgi:hypothetical protein